MAPIQRMGMMSRTSQTAHLQAAATHPQASVGLLVLHLELVSMSPASGCVLKKAGCYGLARSYGLALSCSLALSCGLALYCGLALSCGLALCCATWLASMTRVGVSQLPPSSMQRAETPIPAPPPEPAPEPDDSHQDPTPANLGCQAQPLFATVWIPVAFILASRLH